MTAAVPVKLDARITHVSATGSLGDGDVKRALARALPALRKCARSAGVISVRFKVGDNRRAEDVEVSPAAECVASAIRTVRTEAAPDTGGATVSVTIEIAP